MADVTILSGLVGGILGTIVMTVFMMTVGDDSPPPTALFWSTYVGDDRPEAYMMQGMVLHFLYGIGAGAVLAVALPVAGFETVELLTAVGLGLGYGFVLFVVAAVFWMKLVLDMDAEPKAVMGFLFFHLIYGGVLGAVIGVGPV